MTAKSKRTNPLDRDGDGDPGGSLPGNQTAPMAHAVQAPGAGEPSWTRDNAAILLKLAEAGIEIDTTKPVALAEETLSDWSNEDAHAAEIFADKMTAEGSHMDEEGGDWPDADLNPIAIPAVLERYVFRNVEQGDTFDAGQAGPMADADPAHTPDEASAMRVLDLRYDAENTDDQAEAARLFAAANEMADRLGLDRETLEPLAGDTFDAEQVAAATTAGEGAVIAEEGETVADPATATAPLDDGLVNIPTDTAPVAVRLHELRILVTARRLYKSPEGYSSNYGPPYIDQATVDAWIAAGLAEDVPTAGNMGGVRVTSEGRSALNRAPADEAA